MVVSVGIEKKKKRDIVLKRADKKTSFRKE